VIALNKPEGFLTIPDGYFQDAPNLRDILRTKFGRIWVVHRLDKDTSGVIVFAKNAIMHKKLNDAFSHRQTKKKYIAFIHGVPFWTERIISYPLLINGDRRHRTIINLVNGKPAETIINITEKKMIYSEAIIWPKTGYTHQIRSHLSQIGHPVIGDALYDMHRTKAIDGAIQCPQTEKGLFLHASELKFIDKSINLPLFEAKVPKKFSAFHSEQNM